MESVTAVWDWLTANWVALGSGLYLVTYGFSLIAKITPWDWDNKATGWVLNLLPVLGIKEPAAKAKK